ncbi:N6-adenosine-methyltransferase subunit METTL3-like [Lineus longissimus]|uniref:N6-adenosine-methyltransferase subunit METTL3-like n=1 Tax=Lineus longissimus TaxID=88925 RepID=UPI002B4D2A56
MSDTWSDIQATKNKQSSLREKLLRRRREREGILADISGPSLASAAGDTAGSSASTSKPSSRSSSPAPSAADVKPKGDVKTKLEPIPIDPAVEKQLLNCLSDISLNFPLDASQLESLVSKALEKDSTPISAIEDLLEKFAAQQLISIQKNDDGEDGKSLVVLSTDHSKLEALIDGDSVKKRKKDAEEPKEDDAHLFKKIKVEAPKKDDNTVESLLMMQSAKEREEKKLSEEILQLLSKPTAKERSLVEKFRSQGGGSVQEFCQYGTKEECTQNKDMKDYCKKLHFRKIIRKHTDESLGDCSFLNTCFHMDTCKYVHYEIDYPEKSDKGKEIMIPKSIDNFKRSDSQTILYPQQWIHCDLRNFDMSTIGKCGVVMADPPWDIHMELPYGTMSDDEMRALDVPALQDDGFIFLWVTGRAMELGRECLKIWGYERIDELIWVKTNQLQRIIRTGRTGHWLNHGKEHCLIGKKGNPQGINKGIDADVLVAEVRATSHKPDEVYGIIERLSPGTRKVELFGRPHNVQPNWITLGNQLDGVRLLDPEIVKNFKERYPDGSCLGSKK